MLFMGGGQGMVAFQGGEFWSGSHGCDGTVHQIGVTQSARAGSEQRRTFVFGFCFVFNKGSGGRVPSTLNRGHHRQQSRPFE